jgi:hypothetical protein
MVEILTERYNTLCTLLGERQPPSWGFSAFFSLVFCNLFCGNIYPVFVNGLLSYLDWFLMLITPSCLDWSLKPFSEM